MRSYVEIKPSVHRYICVCVLEILHRLMYPELNTCKMFVLLSFERFPPCTLWPRWPASRSQAFADLPAMDLDSLGFASV